MKVLITGGAGFIGSHIAEYFHDKAEVRILDNLRSGFTRNLCNLRCKFIQGSILDRNIVKRAMQGIDYVFHLAAMTSISESMQKPNECAEINANGTLIVLDEASRSKVKKLVLSSSAAIYGNSPFMPKKETTLPEPNSPYAISKLNSEFYCEQFASERRLQTTCLRYFNVFGQRQCSKNQYAAVMPIFINRAMQHEPITIYGDGEQTRDFIYVKDIVAANVFFAIESKETGIFNVGYGQDIAIKNLAATICHILNSRSKIQYTAERPGDVKYSLAAIDKLRSVGFTSVNDFFNGLLATIKLAHTS